MALIRGNQISGSVASASYATTASYAQNAGVTIDTGSLVTTSSFNNFTASYTTGSFTGSFVGDGSQLTGIVSSKWTGSNPISRQSDVEITGSLRIQGSITGSLFGTASNATTASYYNETDPLFTALSGSYTTTSSFNQFTGSIQQQVNSLTAATSSYVLNSQTGSMSVLSSSFASTASFAQTTQTASYFNETDPIFVAKSGSFATTGSNTFIGTQTITGSNGKLIYTGTTPGVGSNPTLAEVHANDDFPWLHRFYNDTFSTSSAVMAYYGWNDGRFVFHNESTQSIGLQVNGFGAENGLLVYSDKVAFVNNVEVTGSINVVGGITGSLFGTASWATNAVTASYITASRVFGPYGSNSVMSASYAQTASYSRNLQISGSVNNVDYIDFNTGSAVPAWKSGRVFWDNTDGALSVYNAEADITLQVGQENWTRVSNRTGTTITNGTVVRLLGAHGDVPEVERAQSLLVSGSVNVLNQILGVATHDIEHNSKGFITTQGLVRGLNTNAFNDGDTLFVGTGSAGVLQNTAPQAPYEIIPVGVCVKAGPGGSGIIYVAVQEPIDFSDLSSVLVEGIYHYGDLWTYVQSGSTGVWTHTNQLSGSYGLTGSLTATSITASNLYAGATYISGSLIVNGPSTFYGTASFVNVTASNLFVSESFISVNVFEPVERFGGLKVYDSGSSTATASLAWDSLHNHWVYQNVDGLTYTGGMLLSGPRNTGSLGDEPNLTKWLIPRSDGGDHLDNSQIFTSGSITQITGSLTVTSGVTASLSGTASFATSASRAISSSFTTTASYAVTASKSTIQILTGLDTRSFALTMVESNTATSLNNPAPIAIHTGTPLTYTVASGVGTLNTTASFATSASFAAIAATSSYAETASFALTASYVNPLYQDVIITGSLIQGADGNIVTGFRAHAEGTSSFAGGWYSHAEGQGTYASGFGAHAEGFATIANVSFAHAEGAFTSASNTYSHAEGMSTRALGVGSHAEGSGSFTGTLILYGAKNNTINAGVFQLNGDVTAIFAPGNRLYYNSAAYPDNTSFVVDTSVFGGVNTTITLTNTSITDSNFVVGSLDYSYSSWAGNQQSVADGGHAEGYYTNAVADWSHTEGVGTQTFGRYAHAEGDRTQANGQASHAEGRLTKAFGSYSHAEGNNTRAFGIYSHAEGSNTIAHGSYSHAEGNSTTAVGEFSHAEGNSTAAGSQLGYLATVSTPGVIVVNASYGDLTGTGAGLFTAGTTLGIDDSAYDNSLTFTNQIIISCSFDGTNTIINLLETSISTTSASIGSISNFGSNAGDQYWGGYSAHAEGNSTFAIGASTHAEGGGYAYGNYSHAEGSAYAYGDFSHAEGSGQAFGQYSHAEGSGYTYSNNSHAEGAGTAGVRGFNISIPIASGVIELDAKYGDQTAQFVAGGFVIVDDNQGEIVPGVVTTYIYEIASSTFNGTPATEITLVDTSVNTASNKAYIGIYGVIAPTAADISIGGGSHAEGETTQTIGTSAHAAGYWTQALGWYQSVVGQFNEPVSQPSAFVVGDGVDDTTRHNLLVAASGSVTISGSLKIHNITTATLTSISASFGTTPTSTYAIPVQPNGGAWFEYVIRSGSNARTGQIMAVWDDTLVNFTDTATTDLGDTSGVTLAVTNDTSNINFDASATTNNWSIKAIVRYI